MCEKPLSSKEIDDRIKRARKLKLILVQHETISPTLVRYTLFNPTSKKEYIVEGDRNNEAEMVCSCPDHKFRHGTCKHILFITRKIQQVERLILNSTDTEDCGFCLEATPTDPFQIFICKQCNQKVHLDCYLDYCRFNSAGSCIYCRYIE